MTPRIAIGTVALLWALAACHTAILARQANVPAQTSSAAAPRSARSVWDGVYTTAQAKRGEALYEHECSRCHGQALEGNGEGSGPLAGIEFLSTWNGLTLGDLLDRIRLTMPLDKPGKLGRQENADVLAYIVSMNKFPAGEIELPRESERLKEIRLDAFKR